MILRQISNEIGLIPINNVLTGSISTVPDNTLSTILTLNATTNHKIVKVSCSSHLYAKYMLYVDTNLIETRIASPNRTIDFNFNPPLLINNGQIVDIKVIHYFLGETPDFQSTIYSII
jgi:hypothetical protein